jgi:hypothetical protein
MQLISKYRFLTGGCRSHPISYYFPYLGHLILASEKGGIFLSRYFEVKELKVFLIPKLSHDVVLKI